MHRMFIVRKLCAKSDNKAITMRVWRRDSPVEARMQLQGRKATSPIVDKSFGMYAIIRHIPVVCKLCANVGQESDCDACLET